MVSNTTKVRIIFGLKIRQFRLEKNLSLAEVAKMVDFSVSYLNEIEKGKKYPKSEKILALANAFNTDYDSLVSLKLTNELEPIADILNSNILSDLPLEMFGIEPSDFVDLMSKSPSKISAFINTLKEISRTYDIQNEEFYVAVLRSYQEMNENYFEEIEQIAAEFRAQLSLQNTQAVNFELLKKLLHDKFDYAIKSFKSSEYPELTEIDIIYPSAKNLLYNENLNDTEKAFAFAKEIGFNVLGLKERPSCFPIVKVTSFQSLFNQQKATYFAGALLINKDILIGRLTYFLASPKWDAEAFLGMIKLFNAPANVFVTRLTNLLSGHFKLNNLFLLGIKHDKFTGKFSTADEMHLRQLHSPHGYARNEHYCRRWLGLNIFNTLNNNILAHKQIVCGSQISEFTDSKSKYFVITVASNAGINSQRSDTIGFVIDAKLKAVINFVNDPTISKKQVNQTCERCNMKDCAERVAEPTVYNMQMKKLNVLEVIDKMF
jgi:XRE family transcriptional regulator, fatty acid utilization regulator